jgi:hypothetical protein
MSAGVVAWWFFLCAVAGLNITLWSLAAHSLQRRRASMAVDAYHACRIQLVLCAGYVFGCAFRSALPTFDIPRLCLFDVWLADVIVGRSVATFAELCFAGQWAVMLHATARSTGSEVARVVSLMIVPLVATAEVCSWCAVLTTSNLGHVAENSLWGVSAALGVVALISIVLRSAVPRRRVLIAWSMAGIAYVAFMFLVDVPTYWSRWVADQAVGRQYLSITQGLYDVSHRRQVSYRWNDWKGEVTWMTLYFSAAVWISISLVQARIPAERTAKREANAVTARRFPVGSER